MFRMLKAFAWMRWRMLANSLERTGSRDTLERFSIAIENLGPIIAAVLLIPSALILGGLGVAAGYDLPGGERSIPFQAARILLLIVPALAIVGPLFMPAADRTNPVRLLLLPIPRSTLYVAQSSAAFGDPWTMLMIPLALGVPVGLAAAGAPVAAALALVGALLLIVAVVGISSLATSILHLVARDRRRGEVLALLFIVILPLVGLLPGLLQGSKSRSGEPREPLLPAWTQTLSQRALSLHPAEMFSRGARTAAAGDSARAAAWLAGLAAATLVLHGFGLAAFRKVLDSPGASSARRGTSSGAAWTWKLPGLSAGASAVAFAHFRLALRTTRGRSILLSPIAIMLIFGLFMYRGSGSMDLGPFKFASGIGLATFASAMSLLSILPIAMNQFAVDGAGLTMTLLSPLPADELLAGKAAGNALVVLPPVVFVLLATALAFPGGSLALWISLPLALLSIYFLFAPVAAICSAILPRAVDMNSIGRGSNAHGAAGLLGLIGIAAAAVPPVLIVLLATKVLDRPISAPLMLLAWCVLAYGIGRLLFRPARRVFSTRRENLAMTV